MNTPTKLPPGAGGLQQVRVRLLTWWPVKMLGTTLGMAAFFVVYFWVLRHPFFAVTTMSFTALDRWIGFQPAALPLYLSLWIYVSLVPALLIDRRELLGYTIAAIGLSAIGLAIFILWPTTIARPETDWAQLPAFAFLGSVDAAGNACPSLHVAFAVFTAAWFGRILQQIGAGRVLHVANWLWCAGIMYSTIAIGEHVALDVLAGSALGVTIAVVNLRCVRAADQQTVRPTNCSGRGTTHR